MSWRAFAAAALALLVGGCALLPSPRTAGEAAPPAAAVPPPVELQIDAPEPLRALLARHLDLARLGELRVDVASIGEAEWSRLIAAAPLQARELLQTEGYFAPNIGVERSAAGERGRPDRVRLVVDPGPRTLVARVTFEVEGALERAASAGDAAAQALLDELRQGWPLPAGSVFRNAAWNDAKAAALARLRAAGYATATWAGTGAQVDAEQHSARIFVVADSGPLFRSGELQIEGLVEQDAATVRHLADFDPGTPVTETLLLDFQERLQGSGLFDSVAVTLDTDPARADAAPVLVRLREAPMQVYTFAIGVSANTGPRASIEHVYRRVFGHAATARNRLEYGGRRQAWDGELSTHPQPGLTRDLVGGAFERLESSVDVVLSQRLRLGRARDVQRREQLSFAEVERASRRVGGQRTDTIALSLNHHLVLRRLDSFVLPTDGYTLSLQSGVGRSHGTASESGLFGRLYGRLTVYRPIGAEWYAQARVEFGQMLLQGGVAAPETQRWRAGGDDSVRGYAYRSLGPVVDGAVASGDVLFTSSIEFARPISLALPSLWGAVFVDAGNAAARWRELDPVLGIGAGLRWRSPVGPLRLDYAWGRALGRGRFHFSVGIAF